MISLCVITNTVDIGGAETQLLRLGGRLQNEGIELTIVYFAGKGELRDDMVAAGIKVVSMDRDRVGRARFIFGLRRFLRENRFDVVHCWRGTANQYGGLAAVLARCGVILTGHRNFAIDPLPIRALDRLLRPFTKLRIVNSYAIRGKHAATAWFPEDFLRVVYNGLDPDEFVQNQSVEQVRDSLGLQPDKPLLIHVGRLGPPKRQHLFIGLAERLTRAGHDCNYVLVGTGPDEEVLRQQIVELSLGDRVTLLGRRRDVPRLIYGSTLCVCTSKREGLPNVVLESMMAGTPVITTDNGGGPELVANQEQVVPRDGAEALAERVGHALSRPDVLDAWSEAGIKRAQQMFVIDQAVASYAGMIRDVLGVQC